MIDWDEIVSVNQEDNTYKVPKSWLFTHYYEALNILFRFENVLRVFVYVILKNIYFDRWAIITLPGEGKNQDSIASIAKRRIGHAKSFGYIGDDIACPIMYLTSGELIEIITADNYWKDCFCKYFKGGKDIIKTKLLEINTTRNALAHFRPIKNDDVSYMKQNVKHTLLLIEESLSQLLNISQVVPTNSEAEWYKMIRPLDKKPCSLQLYQSKDESWIRVQLTFTPEILSSKKWGASHINYQLLNLKSPEIIKEFSKIAKYITCLIEYPPYGSINGKEKETPWINKNLQLIFSKNVLDAHCDEIVSEIEKINLCVAKETDLVKHDNLARGKLVESVTASANLKKVGESERWDFNCVALKCSTGFDSPTEYWGDTGFWDNNFASHAVKYPWMPSEISWEVFPF